MSNLIQRVLVAVIAIPIVLFIVLFRPLAFFILAVILAGLTVHEYYGLAKVKGYRPQVTVGVIFTMLITLSFGKFRLQSLLAPVGISVISPQIEMLSVIIILASVVILSAELFRNLPNPLEQTAVTLFGAIYIGLGDLDTGMSWLEKAYREHSDYLIYLNADPMADTLRSNPRFQAVLRKIGMSDASKPTERDSHE